MKKIFSILIAGILLVNLCGCGNILTSTKASKSTEEQDTLRVAYQYGMPYVTLMIMQEKGLIEKHYDGNLTVEWVNLNSGSAINEGMAGGDLDVGCIGIPPFLTGVTKGIPYKMFGTVCNQPNKLMTNVESIKTLDDITRENKIAMLNMGSIYHIMLAMWSQEVLGDACALEQNIVAMSHADGMAALLSGSVECQFTTSPYIYQEMEVDNVHEVEGFQEIWPEDNALVVGVISDKIYTENPKLYEAVVAALQEATDFVNSNHELAADIVCPILDISKEEFLTWMQDPACKYDMKLSGIMETAEFMKKNGFLEKAPESFEEITTESAR